ELDVLREVGLCPEAQAQVDLAPGGAVRVEKGSDIRVGLLTKGERLDAVQAQDVEEDASPQAPVLAAAVAQGDGNRRPIERGIGRQRNALARIECGDDPVRALGPGGGAGDGRAATPLPP